MGRVNNKYNYNIYIIIYRKQDNVDYDLDDEIDVDSMSDEIIEQEPAVKKGRTAQKVFECENEFCRDYGKTFKYNSAKLKHDG